MHVDDLVLSPTTTNDEPTRFAHDEASAASFGAAPGHVLPVMGALLDELDYGMVLVRDDGRIVHINHAARTQLREGACVSVCGGMLQSRRSADAQPLADALAEARRGRRRLIAIGPEGSRIAVAVIPVCSTGQGAPTLVAAVFSRPRLCERMSVHWFARAHGLTGAETRVLELLCDGLDPGDIASLHERGIATVRTQVSSIRDKTGTGSIRELLGRLATLPPMVSALRC
jgi:DNA-binding CsgD family transcriptional regulator